MNSQLSQMLFLPGVLYKVAILHEDREEAEEEDYDGGGGGGDSEVVVANLSSPGGRVYRLVCDIMGARFDVLKASRLPVILEVTPPPLSVFLAVQPGSLLHAMHVHVQHSHSHSFQSAECAGTSAGNSRPRPDRRVVQGG